MSLTSDPLLKNPHPYLKRSGQSRSGLWDRFPLAPPPTIMTPPCPLNYANELDRHFQRSRRGARGGHLRLVRPHHSSLAQVLKRVRADQATRSHPITVSGDTNPHSCCHVSLPTVTKDAGMFTEPASPPGTLDFSCLYSCPLVVYPTRHTR